MGLAYGLENVEFTDKFGVHSEDRPGIVDLTTVVGCREHSDELAVEGKKVAILLHLMCTADEIQIVLFQKCVHGISAEHVTHAALGVGPECFHGPCLIGITPEEVRRYTGTFNIAWPFDLADVVQRVEMRRDPSVRAEDLVADDTCQRHPLECADERFPQTDRISSLDFIVEPVDSGQGFAFMIPPEKDDRRRIQDLVREKQCKNFEIEGTSVTEIAQKNESRLRRIPQPLENADEVQCLPVYVSTHVHTWRHLHERRSGGEKLSRGKCQVPQIGDVEIDPFHRARTRHVEDLANKFLTKLSGHGENERLSRLIWVIICLA